MPRPILHGDARTAPRLSTAAPATPARTSALPAHELARRLREPRTRAYVQRVTSLDVGTLHDTGAVHQLLEEISAEFPELGIEDFPQGWVSRCYLGEPFEVHVLDAAGCIVQHYRRGEALPAELERARTLALHPSYAFIEVRRDTLHCVREDGTVTCI